MRRTFRPLLVGTLAACIGLLGVPAAEAASVGTAQFVGTFTLGPPPLPTVGVSAATPWTFATTACNETLAAHVAKPKPLTSSGPCGIAAAGVLTGNCLTGVGTGAGVYLDSLAQPVFLSFVMYVNLGEWRWVGTAAKGAQPGTFTAFGTWGPPAPAGCGVMVTTGFLTYTLG
ncbi:MAG TPA: hypothetical protein VGB03_08120 [Acidimicrobiales bacterium]|jgi:hypothetical protein